MITSRFGQLVLALLGLVVVRGGAEGAAAEPHEIERPSIWVRAEDRAEIQAMLDREPWAQARYDALRSRATSAVVAHRADRAGFLAGLPWAPDGATGEHPALMAGRRDPAVGGEAQHDFARVQRFVLNAVDCGVVYYLTGDEHYARCAADVLRAVVEGLLGVEPNADPVNGGWLYQNDHLFEARAIGAQLPLVYDLVAPYLRAGGTVWDLALGGETEFDPARAQQVFRTYARLALERGIISSNWPVLELGSLLHNALALDDPTERAEILRLALEVDLPHQDSLRKMLAEFTHAGGVWPESLQYSGGVLQRLIYTFALLQRQRPALALPSNFGDLPRALLRLEDLVFPNGESARIGDGPRRYRAGATSLEIGYAAALREPTGQSVAAEMGAVLQRRISAGAYDRAMSVGHPQGADNYYDPLALLWYAPQIVEQPTAPRALPTTDVLPFAGLVLQRNLTPDDDPRHGLMAVVSGGHYVHAHASGMALELYGAGQVLGTNAGKGRYTTDEHENYRRLFAAHNTVIVNGASRSEGGWVNLGINQVDLVASEPAVGEPAVSPNHSFTLTRFRDDRGDGAEAEQERLVALVRTGPTSGFYVDVFRSRSALPGQYHDYVYHNLGDSWEFVVDGSAGELTPAPDRFRPVAGAVWRRNRSFLWPGWHVFTDVAVSGPVSAAVNLTVIATDLPGGPAGMRVHFPAGPVPREFALARAPATAEAPAPYRDRLTPTLVVRQWGPAWDEPFAAVYEPQGVGAGTVVKVERLEGPEGFAGLKVTTREGDQTQVHDIVIMTNDDAIWTAPDGRSTVQGRYAVVTRDAHGSVVAAYLGRGILLTVDDLAIRLPSGVIGSAFGAKGPNGWRETATGQRP